MKDKYDIGYVCFMDILGFSEFSKGPNNHAKIDDVIQYIYVLFHSYEDNKLFGDSYKITVASDSLIITIKYEDALDTDV